MCCLHFRYKKENEQKEKGFRTHCIHTQGLFMKNNKIERKLPNLNLNTFINTPDLWIQI